MSLRSCLSHAAVLAILALPVATAAAPPAPAQAAPNEMGQARSAALATATDRGTVPASSRITARLLLRRPAALQTRLDELIEAQQDRGSPLYHRWLSPDELGRDFGPSEAAVAKAGDWLRAQGLTVGAVSPSRMTIAFSGTAAAIFHAFGAPVHAYTVHGVQTNAFSSDPHLPASLDSLVSGIVGLDGTVPHPLVRPVGRVVRTQDGAWRLQTPAPGLTATVNGAQQEDVAPADFATIYNVSPLRRGASPILGNGETIAVVEDSDFNRADWNSFRSAFGLSAYAGRLTTTHPGCADPGRNGDEGEAALDAEWATAVAPAASITESTCSNATGGIDQALQGLVDASAHPQVVSVSFGECEPDLGASAAESWAGLLEQGASEGISIFVSTGDAGAAGCDPNASIASHGIAVNGLASSPYDVAVGGTDFADFTSSTVSTYWNTTNTSAKGSARSYIPELPWNDTCANPALAAYEGSSSPLAFCNTSFGANFLATTGAGGGQSALFAKPAFQTGVYGIPDDGARDLPDVVLFAANGLFGHALVYCMSDTNQGGTACNYANGSALTANSGGGTSFAAPAFAGIQALIDQKKGGPQGNPDARLYALSTSEGQQSGDACNAAAGAAEPAACVFYDISAGGIDQACQSGSPSCTTAGGQYGVLSTSATTAADAWPSRIGFDLATGLGSVNVTNLVNDF